MTATEIKDVSFGVILEHFWIFFFHKQPELVFEKFHFTSLGFVLVVSANKKVGRKEKVREKEK